MALVAAGQRVVVRDLETGRFLRKVHEDVKIALAEAIIEGRDRARELAPDGEPRNDYWRRPKLHDAIESAVERDGTQATITLDGPAAVSLERGSRPHDISGTWGSYLYFPSNVDDGRLHRSRTVHHPGTHAMWFGRAGWEHARDEFTRRMRELSAV